MDTSITSISRIKAFCIEYKLFGYVLLFKLLLLGFFSSDFKDIYFVPFVSHFITHLDNPWQYFLTTPGSSAEFPYHPLMLYIFSLSHLPSILGGWAPGFLSNIMFKLPILLADLLVTVTLFKHFPNKKKEIFLYYFISPIILFAAYMHSQLDLIPTAFLFLSLLLLFRNKTKSAGLWFGLALATKLHVTVALPLIGIHFYRQKKLSGAVMFFATGITTYLFFIIPYLFSPGFIQLVLTNPKQSLLFDLALQNGPNVLYLTIAILVLFYFKFFLNKKTNQDLLYSFLTIFFSILLLLILPRPGWYIWVVPFLSVFLIKEGFRNRELRYLLGVLNGIYIVFFVFVNQTEVIDLTFLGAPAQLKLTSGTLPGIIYTLLEVTLLMMIYLIYKLGVKSNRIYKYKSNLIIGIGGDTGCGKTTLLNNLVSLSPNKFLALESDGAHKWERGDQKWEQFTHSDPKANNLHDIADKLITLRNGHTTPFRFYEHSTGKFTSPIDIVPKEIILLSGLHPFYLPIMRKITDVKIFLDTDEGLRRLWKIKRDILERNKNLDTVLLSIGRREKDSKKNIQPQKDFSDIIFRYTPKKPVPNKIDEKTALNYEPELNLTITCKSTINIDPFIQEAKALKILDEWDYLEGLEYVFFKLSQPFPVKSLNELSQNHIFNLEELADFDVKWASDYNGTCQFFVIYFLSLYLKHTAHKND